MRSPFKKRSTPTASTASKSPQEKQRSRTEKIAYELYQTRQLLNRTGDTHTDWEIAERIVQSRLRLALYHCHRPFIRLEKNTWEPLLAWANNQALLSLLGLVGNIGLIIAVATYIGSEKHRRNAEVLNAWQTITNAHGQAGSGGRIQALEFLNASPGANWRRKFPWVCPLRFCLWKAESLDGIDLSVEIEAEKLFESTPEVYLKDLELPEASLERANLANADLERANLANANLRYSNLVGVHLAEANLSGANLLEANLAKSNWREAIAEEANLGRVNLEGAYLIDVNLEGAFMLEANLERVSFHSSNLAGVILTSANLKRANLGAANLVAADLREANLEGAYLGGGVYVNGKLTGADLRYANLRDTNLKGADLRYTNLEGARNLTTEQLSQAKLCLTQLPEDFDLLEERDCEELGLSSEP